MANKENWYKQKEFKKNCELKDLQDELQQVFDDLSKMKCNNNQLQSAYRQLAVAHQQLHGKYANVVEENKQLLSGVSKMVIGVGISQGMVFLEWSLFFSKDFFVLFGTWIVLLRSSVGISSKRGAFLTIIFGGSVSPSEFDIVIKVLAYNSTNFCDISWLEVLWKLDSLFLKKGDCRISFC